MANQLKIAIFSPYRDFIEEPVFMHWRHKHKLRQKTKQRNAMNCATVSYQPKRKTSTISYGRIEANSKENYLLKCFY